MKFPENILKDLVSEHAKIISEDLNDKQKLAMYSEARLNWLNAIVSDQNYDWELEKLPLDKIQLTGTIPEYNKIIIDICHRSVKEFKLYLKKTNSYEFFHANNKGQETILVIFSEGKYSILHGMYHVIELIKQNVDEIEVWVGHNAYKIQKPYVDPQVPYFFLREMKRGTIPPKELDYVLSALKLIYEYTSNGPELLGDNSRLGWETAMTNIIKDVKKN